MNKIVEWSSKEREELFELTATDRGMSAAVVEKDFWVCWVLGKLFASEDLRGKILFKGGTSLSKVFGLIERFSEDIDLILNWDDFVPEPPGNIRSLNQQKKFRRAIDEAARAYLINSFVPILKKIIDNRCKLIFDTNEPNIIKIGYPASFGEIYLRPEIQLDISPFALWDPHDSYNIKPYAAEEFPEKFDVPEVVVQSIGAERTFWEKATILHVVAQRSKEQIVPERYSRHYYDMMRLANSMVKQRAFSNLDLLASVVEFKSEFYRQAWANYNSAIPGSFRLYPPEHVMKSLERDYVDMQIMIFGETPSFEEIMNSIKDLESEINQLRV